MKRYVTALVLVAALAGCEDATKAIDQAQEAANKAVDTIQEQMESVDLSKLNLDQFGDATESAKEFALSVEEALNADFTNPEALTQMKENIANTYACLVDATSESTAEKLLDKVLATISNQEAQSLVEKGIEKAKSAQKCVM
ncbi:lipoprotein [Vibrio kasasachensis]|uniref:lipoprotein n=1 Tax=Vibrio kasasachensis TaxID=2910248 RepID=UPI003D131B61